jgi:ABC-type sugar transport system permease subunit
MHRITDPLNTALVYTTALTGTVVASSPELVHYFWESREWTGAVAIGGFIVTILAAINLALSINDKIKGRRDDSES